MQTVIKNKKKVDLKGQNQFNTPHTQIAQSVELSGNCIENPLWFFIKTEIAQIAKSVELSGNCIENPLWFFINTEIAQIAQSVEQRIENPRVGGSIPSLGTTLKNHPL